MKRTRESAPLEQIEREVDQGKEVLEKYFNTRRVIVRQGRQVRRILKTNLDLTEEMAKELDAVAESLNVSRQAVIKVYLRQVLDQRALAEQAITRK